MGEKGGSMGEKGVISDLDEFVQSNSETGFGLDLASIDISALRYSSLGSSICTRSH